MLVRDRMRQDPITVGPDASLAHALHLTRTHHIRHLPVVLPGDEITGILSDRDIRLAMPSPLTVPDPERTEFLERTPVAAVMTREVVTTTPYSTVEDAAKTLYRHRIGSLPVVDPHGRLEGLLSETDILYAFVQIMGGAEPASRVEVALTHRPGELSRAVRIIGDLQLNIVSLVAPSLPDQTRRTVILQLATIDPREAIRALEESGFEVGWPSLDYDLRSMGAE